MEKLMKIRPLFISALAASFAFALTAVPVAQGQSTSEQTTSESASSSKQLQKAQRRADRQAHRAQTNAELREFEKHGYNPNTNEIDYPENLQRAQQKIDAEKQGAKPARTP
jgi:hypothetical protein